MRFDFLGKRFYDLQYSIMKNEKLKLSSSFARRNIPTSDLRPHTSDL